MNALVYITEKSKQLEELLISKYGAKGFSLGTYVNTVEERLPEQVARKIREVVALRNSLLHYPKESDATLKDFNSIARKEFFNIQKKVDYIIKACSYPDVVLAQIDASFKELEKALSKITTLLGSFGIQGDSLNKKINNVTNQLSVETLWKLCEFRDYFERAANDDFADSLQYSQQVKSLYNEIMKDLKGKNASMEKPLSQERYTIDEINDEVKLIDGIHQKLLLLLGSNIKNPTFNLRTVLDQVSKIVDSTFSRMVSIEAGENQASINNIVHNSNFSPNCRRPISNPTLPQSNSSKAQPKPTPNTSLEKASSIDLATVKKMQQEMYQLLGAQLHSTGKSLRTKIDSLKQRKGVPTSVIPQLNQFETQTNEVLAHNLIKPDTLAKLNQLAQDIRKLLEPKINAIRQQNASVQKSRISQLSPKA